MIIESFLAFCGTLLSVAATLSPPSEVGASIALSCCLLLLKMVQYLPDCIPLDFHIAVSVYETA